MLTAHCSCITFPVSINAKGYNCETDFRRCKAVDQWVWENLTSSGLNANCAYWTDLLGVLISFHLSFAPGVRLSKKSINIIACTSTCLLKVKSLIYHSRKSYLSVNSSWNREVQVSHYLEFKQFRASQIFRVKPFSP